MHSRSNDVLKDMGIHSVFSSEVALNIQGGCHVGFPTTV